MIKFVSIVIPLFNQEKYIINCIDSILNQTFKNFEIIIVNDCSTDESLNLLKKYNDKRIKIFSLDKNSGVGTAFNYGVKKSLSKWVFRMDPDDEMLPSRVYSQVKFINENYKNSKLAVISCLATYMGENSSKTFGKTNSNFFSISDYEKFYKTNKLIGTVTPGTVYNKKIFLEVGGYSEDIFPCEDIDLLWKIADKGYYITTIKEILIRYRIHNKSSIGSNFFKSQMQREFIKFRRDIYSKNKLIPNYVQFQNYWAKKRYFF